MACVLHQMPAVGDLDRLGERPLRRQRIAAASVGRHDGDLRLVVSRASAVAGSRSGSNAIVFPRSRPQIRVP